MVILSYIQNLTISEAIASTLGIVGVWYISIPKFRGQIFMLFAQLAWLSHSWFVKSPGLMLQSAILLVLNIKAIYCWYNKKIGVEKRDAVNDSVRE